MIRNAVQAEGDGTWYLHVQAKDAAENKSEVLTVSAILDNTAPVASMTGVPESPTGQSWATLTVAGEGVVKYRFKLNAGDFGQKFAVESPISLSDLSNGTYTVHVVGCDAAGNWQTDSAVASWVVDISQVVLAGDVNGDDVIDLEDAVLVLQIQAGLDRESVGAADVNGDGRVGLEEVLHILQHVAGIRSGDAP